MASCRMAVVTSMGLTLPKEGIRWSREPVEPGFVSSAASRISMGNTDPWLSLSLAPAGPSAVIMPDTLLPLLFRALYS